VIQALKPEGAAKLEIYYRALGRFPGGNADMHTVKIDINCADLTCSIRDYMNWDGDQQWEEFMPPKLNAALADKLPSLCEVIGKSVLAEDKNSVCGLVDTAMDSDEYDSEWSSQEILVFIPRVWSPKSHRYFSETVKKEIFALLMVNSKLSAPKIPKDVLPKIFNYLSDEDACVSRLHRFAMENPNAYSWGKKKSSSVPKAPLASPLQEEILSSCDKILGMGRVNQWSDAGDDEEPCLLTKDRPGDAKTLSVRAGYEYSLPYVQPIFLRWPSGIYKK
jgi:hypothetical protein